MNAIKDYADHLHDIDPYLNSDDVEDVEEEVEEESGADFNKLK